MPGQISVGDLGQNYSGGDKQFGGWIETKDVGDCRAIERQVQPRPDADLKNQTLRRLDSPLAIRVEYPVPHSEVEQTRHNPAFVEPHYRGLAAIAPQSRITVPVLSCIKAAKPASAKLSAGFR